LHGHNAVSNCFYGFIQRLFASARDGHSRAFFLKAFRCRQADAAVSAGHYRHFSFESFHVRLLLLPELPAGFLRRHPCRRNRHPYDFDI